MKSLKGPEVPLPEGHHFDKHGVPRHHIRVRWWKENATTYRELGQVHDAAVDSLPDLPLPQTATSRSHKRCPSWWGTTHWVVSQRSSAGR